MGGLAKLFLNAQSDMGCCRFSKSAGGTINNIICVKIVNILRISMIQSLHHIFSYIHPLPIDIELYTEISMSFPNF